MSEKKVRVGGDTHDEVDIPTPNEPAVDEATGDHVQVCCHCDRTLGPISPHELPARWYTHSSLRGRHPQAPLLAAEVINGDYPDRSTSG